MIICLGTATSSVHPRLHQVLASESLSGEAKYWYTPSSYHRTCCMHLAILGHTVLLTLGKLLILYSDGKRWNGNLYGTAKRKRQQEKQHYPPSDIEMMLSRQNGNGEKSFTVGKVSIENIVKRTRTLWHFVGRSEAFGSCFESCRYSSRMK